MNINDNLDEGFNAFSLSPESRDYLITSAKWAKIISITTIVSIGVGLLAMVGFAFYGGFLFGNLGQSNSMIDFMLVAYSVVVLIFTLIGIIPFYFLYKFAAETNGSLVEFKGIPLHKGIGYLKSFFKTVVLFILMTIALYIIVIVVAMSYHF